MRGVAQVLYTGDYSRYPDRHLTGAETPEVAPDVLVVESTYGIAEHEKREDREARFLGWVDRIVKRGGRCLVPVFALGRAQAMPLPPPYHPPSLRAPHSLSADPIPKAHTHRHTHTYNHPAPLPFPFADWECCELLFVVPICSRIMRLWLLARCWIS